MNNKLILTRMKSIRQTIQISSAQKLVAASHIGKARRMLDESNPYHERVRQAICEIIEAFPEIQNRSRYLDTGEAPEINRRGLLVISADRGLAGGYNSNLMKFTEQTLGGEDGHLLVLGRVGQKYLTKAGYDIDTSFSGVLDPPVLSSAGELAQLVMQLYNERKVGSFDVVYTHYTSTIRLTPTAVRLFPIEPNVFGQSDRFRGDVKFEPSPDSVLNMLIAKFIKGYIYGCLVHAWSSELASRITAMDNAIRNGNDMLDTLSLAYNRARQGSITQEITEIVAGASSMKRDD